MSPLQNRVRQVQFGPIGLLFHFGRRESVNLVVWSNLQRSRSFGSGNRAARRLHDILMLDEARALDGHYLDIGLDTDGPRAYCPHPAAPEPFDRLTRYLPYPGEDDNGELLCSPPSNQNQE